MPESIQITDVPAQNMNAQTRLVGEQGGAFVRVEPQSLNAVFIPDLRLQIIKADIVGNNGKFRPKNSILVKLEYPADAAFLQYNPRIVLLRQSGNRVKERRYGANNAPSPELIGTVWGYRQMTRKYAYTRPASNSLARYFSFPIGSPDMQRHGNETSFVLMEEYDPGDANNNVYFTVDRYLAHFADIEINEPPTYSHVRLRRGGLGLRKFRFKNGEAPEAGMNNYVSANIGFQLVTDAGKSNIVYVKVKIFYKEVRTSGNSGWQFRVVKTWSLLPGI
jgi:hypothetical protein